ncbi:MAG: DUF4170 domain-containing protein [Pseudomonadota bacterium]
MTSQSLHLVFGGELVDPTGNTFKDVGDIHVVGVFADYEAAYDAWKAEAQRTVDNAHMRYFISPLDMHAGAQASESQGG